MTLKPATHQHLAEINHAIKLLKRARESAKAAGATNTLARIRKALTSAGGARRHVYHRINRTNAKTAA